MDKLQIKRPEFVTLHQLNPNKTHDHNVERDSEAWTWFSTWRENKLVTVCGYCDKIVNVHG